MVGGAGAWVAIQDLSRTDDGDASAACGCGGSRPLGETETGSECAAERAVKELLAAHGRERCVGVIIEIAFTSPGLNVRFSFV